MSEGKKWDTEKLRLDLVPVKLIEWKAEVYQYGANKYGEGNWLKFKPEDMKRFHAATLRHLFYYLKGERIDQESGLNHLQHAGWNIDTMLWYDKLEKKDK